MLKKFRFVAIALMAFGLSSPAWATLTVQYGTAAAAGDPLAIAGGTTCTDDTACDGLGATAGSLTFSIAGLGTVTIGSVNTGSLSPIANLSFTLNGQTLSGTGTFYFLISDVGFTSPAPPVQLLTTVGGTSIGTLGNLTSHGWADSGNDLFGATGGLQTGDATTTIGGAQGGAASGSLALTSPYSMTMLVIVDVTSVPGDTNSQSFQVNANLRAVPVPEPASVFMLGGALLFTGKLIRKKLAKV